MYWIDLLKYLDIQVFCFDICKTVILSSHIVSNPSMIIMKGMILSTIHILSLTLVCAYNELSVREVKELEVSSFAFLSNFVYATSYRSCPPVIARTTKSV